MSALQCFCCAGPTPAADGPDAAGSAAGFGSAAASHALLVAAAAGDVDRLTAALEAPGVDLDCREGRQRWTALHLAAAGGHVDCVSALLQHGAPLEAAAVDGLTPLHVAAGGGRVACLQVLSQLVGGALLSECHPARAAASRLDVVRKLLGAGADAEAAAIRGLRPLHFAAAIGEAAIVEALLAAGADPLAVVSSAGASARRTTAAQIAGEYGHMHAAQLLAEAAAAAAADAASVGSDCGGGVEGKLGPNLIPTFF